MMAGATTQASTPIGTVTEAQMAKIFVNEYCLELSGAWTCAGSVCVFVMPSASWGSRIPHIGRRSRDCRLWYTARMTRMSYQRTTYGGDLSASVAALTTTDADNSAN